MAAPITHLVLADKVFYKFFKDKKRSDFLVGTSFPDIRYLKVIDREKTHIKNIDLDDVKNEKSSFNAGFKFHSLVDEDRIKFISKFESSPSFPKTKPAVMALKFLEDEVLYNKIKNWKEIIEYFDKIYKEEVNLGVDKKEVDRWHSYLKDYLSKIPTKETRRKFLLNIGLSESAIEEIEAAINLLRRNEILSAIEELYSSFDNIIYLEEPDNRLF